MKQLRGSAEGEVGGTEQRCFELLADVEGYARWHPDVVRSVQVVDRHGDGKPSRVEATVHAEVGPLAHDFHMLLDVALDPSKAVTLTRIPHQPTDPERFEVRWAILPGPPIRIQLDLEAVLEVPRLVPLGSLGDSLAGGFVAAARNELTST